MKMNDRQIVRVGFGQMRCSENPEENISKAVQMTREIAAKGAQIVCFQELFTTQYFCTSENDEAFDLAVPIPGKVTEAFQLIAKELGIVIIAPHFEKRAEGIYHNSAAVIDADGSYLGKYRKMHIPEYPAYYEKFYFTPGDLGFSCFSTRFGRIGVLICWDQWFPEAARLTAMAGADILFYPTAIGKPKTAAWQDYEEWINAWKTIQRSHAIANGIPVVAINRVGAEGPTEFWGTSFACDTFGQMLLEAPRDKEETAVVEFDLSHRKKVLYEFAFFRDRRIDAYSDLCKLYLG